MVEAEITSDKKRSVLWYANEHALSNETLADSDGEIHIVAWTHPGFQLGLVHELRDTVNLRPHGYAFVKVCPEYG